MLRSASSLALSDGRLTTRGRWHCNDFRSELRSSGYREPTTVSRPEPGSWEAAHGTDIRGTRQREKLRTRAARSPSGTV